MTWSEQGKMTTRKVPEEQVERVKELCGNHRRFRQCRRELAKVHQQLREAISELGSTINSQTRKPLSYLALTPKTAAKTATTVRKTRHKRTS
jgi:hypothetical protein